LLSCASGGGFFVGHDSVCAACCHLAAGPDGIPGVQADWKAKVDVWPRATRGAETDIGFYRIPGCRDTYVDAVGGLANPATYPSCATTIGHLAERHAREKNADHPVFDSQSRRRMYTFDFCALSFERHGYLAKERVGFLKNLLIAVLLIWDLSHPLKFVDGMESFRVAFKKLMRKFCVANPSLADFQPHRRA